MRLNDILGLFSKAYVPDTLAEQLEHQTFDFVGLHGSSRALFIASMFQMVGKGIIVVTRNNRDANDLYTDLLLFLKGEQLYLFPSRETLPYDTSEPFREITAKRIIALASLSQKEKGVIVMPVRSFIDYYIPESIFHQYTFEVRKGSVFPLMQLVETLTLLGYTREDRTISPGSFSLRGDILDLFVYGTKYSSRLEFFDDRVESVRAFSPATQRSLREIEQVSILPAQEVILTPSLFERLERVEDGENRDIIEAVRQDGFFKGIENYISLLYERSDSVVDYAGRGYLFFFDSFTECERQASFFSKEAVRIYQEEHERQFLMPPEQLIADFHSLIAKIENYACFSLLPGSAEKTFHFEIAEKRGYRGQIRRFKDEVQELLVDGYTVIVGASYEGQTNRLREMLKDLLNVHERLFVTTLDIHEGFFAQRMKLAIILDREIFNRKKRFKRRFLEEESRPFEGILDVAGGEYIVHVEHGIGIYRGIEKLSTGGVEKDYIKIEYRDGDELFIPVDQVNLIHRYIGQEGRPPRIDKLGSDTWKRLKEHVKRSVKDIAKDLIELYSVRSSLRGHAFSKDTEWQYEFESGFRYEETPDQLSTIEAIKAGMEDPKPMDRLVCGDVGFGKTEVAIRAAFKAVMDGKQVAVLVPTTILAEQHLGTFLDRFSLYPINVEMLSRFKTPKEQKKIVENLKNGLIDVVIGTHRLIQKDVAFKDLGLVIIDEEQRFGVEHKENLKQLRKLVDVITMTATPIPRTLYMSMTQIRDMSVIDTPPRERVPIETFVMEYSEEIVAHAIRREIERGGQVYYVHNRVRTIEERAEALRRLVPEASLEIAHGQLDEHELEEVMKAFYDMEFQILVTTTIIESGLDIPNVNTIIIERADKFGLAQLYQLRGRVGRGKRKAYAYLFHPMDRIITEKAQKRLQVINDHTELGAGYSIALKDLELRGAGNLLGRQQHGEMLTVGFEMYVKLLDEAIRELRGDSSQPVEFEPFLDVKYRGYIPKAYINSEKLRIEIYKRLSGVQNALELSELKEEMVDRFGPIPDELAELFHVVRLKNMCRDVGIKNLKEKENELLLTFEKSRVDILKLIKKINENKNILTISPRDPNTLHIYRRFRDSIEKYDFLKNLFDYEEQDDQDAQE